MLLVMNKTSRNNNLSNTQNFILQYINKVEVTNIKDLQEQYPFLAKSTIYYTIQILKNKNLIERCYYTNKKKRYK